MSVTISCGKQHFPSLCVICKTKLVKNGRNAAGNQRWKCPTCGASSLRKRPDRSQLFTLRTFIDWLLGKHEQAVLDGTQTGRSFRRHIAWCWELRPRIPATGVIYDVIQIDGFNLRTGWCVLVATHRGAVVAAQWCSREGYAAWSALMKRLPPPHLVVCDGGPGMHAALREHWPETRVQRCLVHLQRNVRKYVTTRSKTAAGKGLWGLAKKLTSVKTVDTAEAWTRLLLAWESEHLHLTKARTYRKDGIEVPSWAKPGQQWWYTHQRLRSGHQVLRRVIQKGHLFTFLDPDLQHLRAPVTTNEIEGGTNSQMRAMLRHHRGMPEEHQRRAIEWWLYMHSEVPDPAKVLSEHEPQSSGLPRPEHTTPDPGTALYDTGLDQGEGLWLRRGWAGRG
ncbi:IS1249 family transposase [Leucobacter insecticola]|uniref:Mutator family transposase n=1 Tax=Leucobacter insecticola TaxID=2714934 RepID=A0A6G8FJ78_9MICO|nr:IS1249 family transposase [Leucobacter insecticola]QIM16339.1 IS1249 family transposase [Leucobacter insecticola]